MYTKLLVSRTSKWVVSNTIHTRTQVFWYFFSGTFHYNYHETQPLWRLLGERHHSYSPFIFVLCFVGNERREAIAGNYLIPWPHKWALLLSKEGYSSQVASQLKLTLQIFLGHTSFSFLPGPQPFLHWSAVAGSDKLDFPLPFLPCSSGNNWVQEGSPPMWKPHENRILSI